MSDGGRGGGEARGPRERYAEEVASRDATLANLGGRSARLSTTRVVTFLAAAAALLVVDVAEGAPARAAGGIALLLGGLFVAQVVAHRRVRARIAWERALRGLAQEGGLRMERRWAALEEVLPVAEKRVAPPAPDHPYARDLDVLGEASLFRLAGPVTSERGRARLRSWLLEPGGAAEVAGRRAAVAELAPERGLRHDLAAHGRLHGSEDPPGTERFLAWAEATPWLLERRGLVALTRVLPALLVGLLVADLWFGAPPWWVVPALAHAELLRRHWRRVHADLTMAEDGVALLSAYVPQLRLVEGRAPTSPLLSELVGTLGVGPASASARLRGLARLLDTAQSRRNVFYAPLAFLLLADLHLARALDGWRARSGREVRAWLEALGTWEALSALAAVAHDHPDWVFPEASAEPVLEGEAVGHPLLPPEACVPNDVTVGPPGRFLLVTGSNMSGKSTLLRALGANAVLAAAGAPVCARRMSLPEVRVRTSMRIDDSLAQGVSLFMAELLRIRGIVEDADADRDEPPVLYLLDEILHGTNTAERRVAARAVIRHMLERRAIGAVSTHDLTLAAAPDLEAAAVPVHFRETVGREEGRTRLTFDYALRPGLATTRNALKLLEAVGLGGLVPETGEPGDCDEPPEP